MSIKLTNLTKDYGSGRGIFDLDLEINEGETVASSARTEAEKPLR